MLWARQEEADGVWNQALTKSARRFLNCSNNKKDMGPICHYKSKGCYKAFIEECSLCTSFETYGG